LEARAESIIDSIKGYNASNFSRLDDELIGIYNGVIRDNPMIVEEAGIDPSDFENVFSQLLIDNYMERYPDYRREILNRSLVDKAILDKLEGSSLFEQLVHEASFLDSYSFSEAALIIHNHNVAIEMVRQGPPSELKKKFILYKYIS